MYIIRCSWAALRNSQTSSLTDSLIWFWFNRCRIKRQWGTELCEELRARMEWQTDRQTLPFSLLLKWKNCLYSAECCLSVLKLRNELATFGTDCNRTQMSEPSTVQMQQHCAVRRGTGILCDNGSDWNVRCYRIMDISVNVQSIAGWTVPGGLWRNRCMREDGSSKLWHMLSACAGTVFVLQSGLVSLLALPELDRNWCQLPVCEGSASSESVSSVFLHVHFCAYNCWVQLQLSYARVSVAAAAVICQSVC